MSCTSKRTVRRNDRLPIDFTVKEHHKSFWDKYGRNVIRTKSNTIILKRTSKILLRKHLPALAYKRTHACKHNTHKHTHTQSSSPTFTFPSEWVLVSLYFCFYFSFEDMPSNAQELPLVYPRDHPCLGLRANQLQEIKPGMLCQDEERVL